MTGGASLCHEGIPRIRIHEALCRPAGTIPTRQYDFVDACDARRMALLHLAERRR